MIAYIALNPSFPTDLLSFRIRPSGIRDSDLVDSAVWKIGDLRRHLRLEAEAVLLQRDALDNLSTEDLVAGLHVGEIQVGEDVREECQHTIADRVPEIDDAVRVAADEARARRTSAFPSRIGRSASGIPPGRTQIGVLDQPCRRSPGKTILRPRLFPGFFWCDDLFDQFGASVAPFRRFGGAVGGAIVHDDNLDLTHIGTANAIDNGPDSMQFVVAGNYNRKREIVFIDHEVCAPLVGIVILIFTGMVNSVCLTCPQLSKLVSFANRVWSVDFRVMVRHDLDVG